MDTPVWSLALRRRRHVLNSGERRHVDEWRALVTDGRARITGIIRQELLSGIRDRRDFERLRERLDAFEDVAAGTADHQRAAAFFNTCRAKGIAPGAVDVLICAVAANNGLAIFTTDTDFTRYAAVLPLRLHRSPAARHA
ncbi:MAG: PIN domain-containing protein [Candidatus Binatia bacterium]